MTPNFNKHPYAVPHSQFGASGRGCGEERGVRNARKRRTGNKRAG